MKNLTKILIPSVIGLSILPMALGGCPFGSECTSDDDCVAPETCNTIIGICGSGEGEGEGEGEGDVSCSGGLDDGACLEARPADLADPYVCDGSICVDPNSLTANCGGGDGASYDGGPVILEVSEISRDNDGETCPDTAAANDGYYAFIAVVYSETAFDDGLNANNLHYINASGTASGTYSDTTILPSVAAAPDIGDGYYILDFYLCGDGGDGAVHLNNNDGGSGNAFCMSMAE
ncbi:MAG: hypothetical protein HYS27_20065 [Deltaproteobacteria bacterium]|nr:hypothetical protein [Deltaproteobacteria bacterium]